MAGFLIEAPHEPEQMACARTVQIFLHTGSHFLTHADWGCLDGEHKAWIIAQMEDRDEARPIVPPPSVCSGGFISGMEKKRGRPKVVLQLRASAGP